jgi:N-acetylneuraminic acid mutarotase
MKHFLILSACVILFACKKKTDPVPNTGGGNVNYTFSSVASFPGSSRHEAVGFTLAGMGYVGLGENYPTVYQNFYKYNPTTNSWSSVADFGGVARRQAVAFTLGDTAYVGLGYGYSGGWKALDDFWKYNPTSNTWVQLNNFPQFSDDRASFVINNVAYVVGGGYLYQYNHLLDSWTLKGSCPAAGDDDAVAFSIGSKGYYGTGYDGNNRQKDFWEYDPSTNVWVQKANFPGNAVNNATGFSIGNYGFLGSGNDLMDNYDAFYKYNPSSNTWSSVAAFPGGGANGMVNFVIGSTAYIGTGYWSGYSVGFYKFQ